MGAKLCRHRRQQDLFPIINDLMVLSSSDTVNMQQTQVTKKEGMAKSIWVKVVWIMQPNIATWGCTFEGEMPSVTICNQANS